MNGTSVVRRYAEGFLEYARETIGFEKGVEELKTLKDLSRENPGFMELLLSPEIPYKEKCSFIDNTLGESFSRELRDFLFLLLKKERIDELEEIAEYTRVKYAHGEEVDAVLTASYPLDTKVLETIKDETEKKLNKKLHLYLKLDPDLLGGIKMVIGNMVIDGSVKRRLEDMKQKLISTKVN